MSLQITLDFLDVIEKLLTILAIVVGGLWAYYNYFRGRVYKPRLEPNITGKLSSDDHHLHLHLNCKLKNVGLSKLDIDHDASGIRVFSYEPPGDITEIERADWQRIGTFPVFENHRWIETGETIENQILLSLQKGNCRAFRVVMRVVGRKISWKSEEIIYVNNKKSI